MAGVATAGTLGTAGCLSAPEAVPHAADGLAYADDPNWRLYGHDTGNTFTNPRADGPSEDPSMQWSFDRSTDGRRTTDFPDGFFRSTPLIVDGTVYTVAENGDNGVSFVGIDAETGSVERLFDAPSILRPTIADGTVYAGVDLTTVRAYDLATGNRQWSRPLGDGTHGGYDVPSSIRRVGDAVVVSHWGGNLPSSSPVPSVTVLDAETGAVRWRRNAVPRVPERLSIVADGSVLLPDTAAIRDLQTAEVSRRLPAGLSDPVLVEGTLYGYLTPEDEPDALVAYDWGTLEERWRCRDVWWRPLVVGNVVVVLEAASACDAPDHHVCITGRDRATGERQWGVDPIAPFDGEIDSVWEVVTVATDETVYVTCGEGTAVALDPTDGSIQWFRQPTSTSGAPVPVGCSVASDLLVTVGGETLYAYS